MGRIQLSYSTFGLTNLGFNEALSEVDRAGYEGVEISFHRRQFNPYNLSCADLDAIRDHLAALRVKPACVATASHFFTPSRPHEPSLLTLDLAGRKRRWDLIRRGIQVARHLNVNLVTFGSGFLRDDHVANPSVDPMELLVEGIHHCLAEIRSDEDITLLIEPEPGMYIETLAQGLALMDAVGSPKFRLHIDICHAYCSELDYISALGRAAPFARYLHISDARVGYNLKLMQDCSGMEIDLDFASALVYFQDTAEFLLVDRERPYYFCNQTPSPARAQRLREILNHSGVSRPFVCIDYSALFAGSTHLDDEIFTYSISVPRLSYDVLERAAPILAWLRGIKSTSGVIPAPVNSLLANTLTGVAHFHEIPGEGSLDFSASFRALTENGFSGFGSVELYHHVGSWKKALVDSHTHLSRFL
ncbi:Hypothetical protein HDN1F_13850 [gamma proteobacterium HdN1]|nr:Hypothetical protein HDN1F_13850 [gamma proteobacterium HdN1]